MANSISIHGTISSGGSAPASIEAAMSAAVLRPIMSK